jgi:phosphatidylglycerophosphatase A
VGFGPWAPGTWGALVAVILYVLLFHRLGAPLYALLVVAVSAIGVWASTAAETWFGKHDDGRIVIDEVAGQLITLAPLVVLHGIPLGRLPLPPTLGFSGGIDIWWLLVVTAFVAFRWFDIRKPGPVKWAEERFKGGVGVMADDIVAGVLGAVVITVPAYFVVVTRLREFVLDSGLLTAGLLVLPLAVFLRWPGRAAQSLAGPVSEGEAARPQRGGRA